MQPRLQADIPVSALPLGKEAETGHVEVGLQEAVEILNAATKGCGSYAKPILRHISTVADFAKRDGVQVC